MAVSSDTLRSAEEKDVKGKAVYILHAWKDALWDMGPSKKADPPAPVEVKSPEIETPSQDEEGSTSGNETTADAMASPSSSPATAPVQDEEQPAPSETQASTEEATKMKEAALTPEGLYLLVSIEHFSRRPHRCFRVPTCRNPTRHRDDSGRRPAVDIPHVRLDVLGFICAPRTACSRFGTQWSCW